MLWLQAGEWYVAQAKAIQKKKQSPNAFCNFKQAV